MPKSKASSKATSASFKSEPTAPIVPGYEGVDTDSLIFPEWSDQELNAEKWDLPKASAKPTKAAAGSSDNDSPAASKGIPTPLPFCDPHSYTLPKTIKAYKWKKPEILFPGKTLVIYKESSLSSYANFIDGSKHLFESSFMRSFISCIGIMEYMGYTTPWSMEGITANYTPNTTGEPWKPWHHIYSMCKAGKGQKHKPQVNKLGKYILRLFWMGSWRRLVIDDFLPVDKNDHVLLPTVQKSKEVIDNASTFASLSSFGKVVETKGKKGKDKRTADENEADVIEMWPFLLCKGLMKIGNLTWSGKKETWDYSVIHSFTGWVCQKLNTINLNPNDIWEICAAYTEHFKWPDEGGKSTNASEKSVASKKSAKSGKTEKSGKKSKKGDKGKVKEKDTDIIPYCVVAQIGDMRAMGEESENMIPSIAPCWGHLFLISQIRDIAINKPAYKPELELWKRFRWIDWARAQGIFTEDTINAVQFFQIVDFFKHVSELVIFPSEYVPKPEPPKQLKEKPISAKQDKKTEKDKAKGKGKDKSDKKSGSKSAKGSKKSKESKDKVIEPPPNPSFWVDFHQLGAYIEHLYIFLRPSLFKTHITITDISEKKSTKTAAKPAKDKKKGATVERLEKKILWPYKLKDKHNEPLYVFLDSLDYQTFAVSFAHTGNRAILEQKCLTVHCDLTSRWQKKFVLDERTKMRVSADLLFETFDWDKDEFGDFLFCINTFGQQTYTASLSPGRHLLRFWIKSETSYTITMLSDAHVEIGTREHIFECLPSESERFIQFCLDFGTHFGNLVQAFGMEDHIPQLQAFYECYRPKGITKFEGMHLDECLFNELEALIKTKYPECGEVMFALRVLFLKPDYGFHCPPRKKAKDKKTKKPKKEKEKKVVQMEPPQWDDDECLSAEMLEESSSEDELRAEKRRQYAAACIQAFFKMIYCRKIMGYRNPANPQYMKIFDCLKKLYKDLFNVDNRIAIFPNMFRNLLYRNPLLTGLLEKYEFVSDLRSVVNSHLIAGALQCKPSAWICISRYEFFVNSPYEEAIRLCLFTNADQYLLQVFDNDSGTEVQRGVNIVSVARYSCNIKGYTVLAYGWSKPEQVPAASIQYKFNFITLKRGDIMPLVFPTLTSSKAQVADVYHHNLNHLIGKCLLWIKQDTSVTLRLVCSYERARVQLICRDWHGKMVQQMEGRKAIVMPLLQLSYEKPPTPTVEVIRQSSTFSASSRKSATSSKASVGSRTKRRSMSERGSTVGSVSSRASKKMRRSSEPIRLEEQGCFYQIEAYIMKESWPLTVPEWSESNKVLTRNLLGNFLMKSSTSVISVKSLLKKMSEISKLRSMIEYDMLPDPKWTMQVICDSSNQVDMQFDRRRVEYIRTKKLQWFEDPLRFRNAKALREQYMHDYSIYEESETLLTSIYYTDTNNSSLSLTEGDNTYLMNVQQEKHSQTPMTTSVTEEEETGMDTPTSQGRTNIKPATLSHMKLPAFDYSAYVLSETVRQRRSSESYLPNIPGEGAGDSWQGSYEENGYEEYIESQDDEPRLKKPEDFEKDIENMEAAIEDFVWYHEEYMADMLDFRERSLQRSHELQDWYGEIRSESETMIADAYKMRQRFINRLKDEEMRRKEATAGAGKGAKGGKKNKKDKKSKSGSSKSSKSSKSNKSKK